MKDESNPPSSTDLDGLPRFLTIAEVADVMRASISSVRAWVASGRLNTTRPGRRRLVPRTELQRFIAGGVG